MSKNSENGEEKKSRIYRLAVRLDGGDFESINEAIAVRRSGLFRVNGALMLKDGGSDERGAVLAEICRDWVEMITVKMIQQGKCFKDG